MKRAVWILAFAAVLAVAHPSTVLARDQNHVALATLPVLPHAIVQRVEHDRTLFTQGLVIDGGRLIESGGNYGQSRLLIRELTDPRPLLTRRLPADWFAEGIAVHDGSLHVLTWREGVLQRYSLPGLLPGERSRYRGEGWGLASDGTLLIHSDGSATLRWRRPGDFSEVRQLQVHAGRRPLERLNELEWVDGWLLANVWLTDSVVAIDPRNGCARWRIDLGRLLTPRERHRADVLNGIAWDPSTRLLWVTGKYWPWLFALEIELPALPEVPTDGGACPTGD